MRPESIQFLSQLVSGRKLRRFEEVLAGRTRHLTVVLEDLHGAHNLTACLRSCECFGIQDVHVIENEHPFRPSRDVALGAAQWLTIIRHAGAADNTPACIERLRARGYRLIACEPGRHGLSLDEFDVREPAALFFGAESRGLSRTVRDHADGFLHLPTVGFTESLNVSVAVAICVQQLTLRLRKSGVDWSLNETEKQELFAEWITGVVNKRIKGRERAFWNHEQIRVYADPGDPP